MVRPRRCIPDCAKSAPSGGVLCNGHADMLPARLRLNIICNRPGSPARAGAIDVAAKYIAQSDAARASVLALRATATSEAASG